MKKKYEESAKRAFYVEYVKEYVRRGVKSIGNNLRSIKIKRISIIYLSMAFCFWP